MNITRECSGCDRRTVLAIVADRDEAEREYDALSRRAQPDCPACGEPEPAVVLRDIYGRVALSSAARD
jgi:hypothetical protein